MKWQNVQALLDKHKILHEVQYYIGENFNFFYFGAFNAFKISFKIM